jgi:hypothetical protein
MSLAGHLAKAASLISGTALLRADVPSDLLSAPLSDPPSDTPSDIPSDTPSDPPLNPPSDPNSELEISFVTSTDLGTLRNDFPGWVGMKFTVGANPLTVTSLGRMCVGGNSRAHTIKLVKVSDGADVSNGSVSVSMADGTAGEFKYGSLANPVTLSANDSYYLVTEEDYNGDQWYDCDSHVTTTGAATCNGFVYSWEPWNVFLYPGRSYGLVNFQHLE